MSEPLLLTVLRNPSQLQQLGAAQWDEIFRAAMQADVAFHLPRLAREGGAESTMPAALRWHLQGLAWKLDAHREEVHRELTHLRHALRETGLEPVLLKGAGYLAADLPLARMRLFSDIDLLVPLAQLDVAEQALHIHGWVDGHPDPHDQAFYREWMHELPPLTHQRRQTHLDLHHTITPRTSRWPVDGQALWAAAVPASAAPGFRVLAPEDRVLHCLVHIVLNEDLRHGLRDLVDLQLMLREATAREPAFWSQLAARAQALGLDALLGDGLALVHQLLGAAVPPAYAAADGWVGRLRVAVWRRALRPEAGASPPAQALDALCRALHYAVALYVRMPLRLSIRHFSGKGWRALMAGRVRDAH